MLRMYVPDNNILYVGEIYTNKALNLFYILECGNGKIFPTIKQNRFTVVLYTLILPYSSIDEMLFKGTLNIPKTRRGLKRFCSSQTQNANHYLNLTTEIYLSLITHIHYRI